MKRLNENRRSGVVLLLILGLMAMFAISVLSYMVVTSNMAETAQNAQKLDSVVDVPPERDLDAALKTLVIGSDNDSNPVAPFSILENMYGNWTFCDPATETEKATDFNARIAIFPNLGCAVLTPCTDFDRNYILDTSGASSFNDLDRRSIFSEYFEGSGNVMTLLRLEPGTVDIPEAVVEKWDEDVQCSSTYVIEKVMTASSSATYKGDAPNGSYWDEHYATEDSDNAGYYKAFDFWHFKIELSDDLKKFASECNIVDFNHLEPVVRVRLNRPAFSGTGAGGFSPGAHHDSTFDSYMVSKDPSGMAEQMRLPFVFWMNASAPDMTPYRLKSSSPWSFRNYWAHLTDVNYDAEFYTSVSDVGLTGNFNYLNSIYNTSSPGSVDSVRMNPSYTAPDGRTPFLAHYDIDEANENGSETNPYFSIIPSFHRPTPFQILSGPGLSGGTRLDDYLKLYHQVGLKDDNAKKSRIYALLRKLTPRPLPLDHWNFTGGNPDVANFYYHRDGSGDMSADQLANTLGYTVQWDVDNDNDGVREGIWVPSGLPIRYDKNGTPYATMFSYTVLDLDGRVNINTAGNWDQLPNNMVGTIDRIDTDGGVHTGYPQPYNYVSDLWGNSSLTGVDNSIFQQDDNLGSTGLEIGWNDDLGDETNLAERGSGFTTSGVLLYEAIAAAFSLYNEDEVRTIASNLLWRRNLEQYNNPMGRVDTTELLAKIDGLYLNGDKEPQPGFGNPSDSVFELFKFFNPTRLTFRARAEDESTAVGGRTGGSFNEDSDASLGEALMVYPWRGKNSFSRRTFENISADYPPEFDWADTAFRSYDPLGGQIYSYAPRYSDNPHRAYQNVLSWEDSPYSLPMLERLLRPSDVDVATLPSQLVDDLGLNSDFYTGITTSSDIVSAVRDNVRDRARARMAFTTLSSDVPAASVVFPENFENEESEIRYGNYGFIDLIRRNVKCELERVFEVKGIFEENLDADGNLLEPRNKYLSYANNSSVFNRKVEEITAYLASMLPKEILAGEKIDLNALVQKNYWLDVDYDASGNLVQADRDLHKVGLVKRMEYARGLYLVLMTLLYEDVNAQSFYDPKVAPKFSDYIEGSFEFDIQNFPGGDDPNGGDNLKDLMRRELIATRVAQWCVNVVDFSDPDATMTPFFFDPNPFDGWWVKNFSWIDGHDDSNGMSCEDYWKTGTGWGENADPYIDFLFRSSEGVPSEIMNDFFLQAFDQSERYITTPSSDYYIPNDRNAEASVTGGYLTSEGLIRNWLQNKYCYRDTVFDMEGGTLHEVDGIEKLEDQTSDLGFRLVWGMERPDLVLTETLSFHDLGVADTELEIDAPGGASASKHPVDQTFDQVRRPQGSSYLELYCTANPNTPQSRELYDYKDGSWRLRLSKTTPDYIDVDQNNDERKLGFPVWRVAISDSSDPRGLKHDKGKSDAAYHKARNSVLDWFIPHKEKEGEEERVSSDISFFSMQPRQFRNAPLPTSTTSVTNLSNLDLFQGYEEDDTPKPLMTGSYLEHWVEYYNNFSSNILGPAVAATYKRPQLREVELDRILWFTEWNDQRRDPMTGELVEDLSLAEYPDAFRTFNKKRSVPVGVDPPPFFLKPNQYLVVGPEKQRSIGSVAAKASLENQQFGQKPDSARYPASFIDISKLRLGNLSLDGDDADGQYKYMEAVSLVKGKDYDDQPFRVGFNISEPLWTAMDTDPYYASQNKKDKINNKSDFYPNLALIGGGEGGVRDIPFEIPNDWADRSQTDNMNDGYVSNFYENRVANYPIVKDKIFGLGTIPAYKSAFVQRVADPNRPYHPLMNPYITVDWNMMDLTVFTGEAIFPDGENLVDNIYHKISTEQLDQNFSEDGRYPFKGKNNKITLAKNRTFGLDDDDKNIDFSDVFSSRQWGSQRQRFNPGAPNLAGPLDDRRPNLWSRAVNTDVKKSDPEEAEKKPSNDPNWGLEKPLVSSVNGAEGQIPVMRYLPRHTLGFFNDCNWGRFVYINGVDGLEKKFVPDGLEENLDQDDRTRISSWHEFQFGNLNSSYISPIGELQSYRGAPRVPFEHFIWNDAPFSNPYELILVPASSSGRFGLEFTRRSSKEMNLDVAYEVDSDKKYKKGALGSSGLYSYGHWFTDKNTGEVHVDGDFKDGGRYFPGNIGAYLNFFASSKKPGETLNFVNLLDLVRTPSYYLGARKLAGVDSDGHFISDEFGNTLIYSMHRDPGKVNINTLSKSVWNALVNTNDKPPFNDDKSIYSRNGTPWSEFLRARFPTTGLDLDGDGFVDELPFTYFQPAYTTPLSIQLTPSPAPIGSYSTLLAQQDLVTSGENSVKEEPLFDNIGQRSQEDDDGNKLFWYKYRNRASGEEVSDSGVTQEVIDSLEEQVYDPDTDTGTIENLESGKLLTARRGNLFDATAEMQRLSGLTTTRSNVFAAWVTVGYFEVERCRPGVNMPDVDPDGNPLTTAMLTNPDYKWYHYYQAIYPDGYTYGKELGEEFGETKRHRGFSIIDRSIPVDFRRGNSVNYEDVILLKRVIE